MSDQGNDGNKRMCPLDNREIVNQQPPEKRIKLNEEKNDETKPTLSPEAMAELLLAPKDKRQKFNVGDSFTGSIEGLLELLKDDEDILLPFWAYSEHSPDRLLDYMEAKRSILTSYVNNRRFYSGSDHIYFEIQTKVISQNDDFNEYRYFRDLIQPFTLYSIRLADIRPLFGAFGKFNGSAMVRVPGCSINHKPQLFEHLLLENQDIFRVNRSSETTFCYPELKKIEDQTEFYVLIKHLPDYCTMDCIKRNIFIDIPPDSIEETIDAKNEGWIFKLSSERQLRKIMFYDGEKFDGGRLPISIKPITTGMKFTILELCR